jgi:alcohol dehydrogenase class IV
LAFGSLSSGLALANSGLGAVHGFAAPIGGMFLAPHGAVCAALLPSVLSVNRCRGFDCDFGQRFRERYFELARILTGNSDATPQDAINWVATMKTKLNIPRLRAFGIGASGFSLVAERAANANSMKGNPVELNHADLIEVLEASV